MVSAREKRGRSGCYWVLTTFLALFLLASLAVNLGLLAGMTSKGVKLSAHDEWPEDEYPHFTDRWSYGDGDAVAVRIPVQGVILREVDGGFLMPRVDMVQSIIHQIRAARNDDAVRAIILEVDSPGGAVTPTDEIYHALMEFKRSDEDRRVVVFTKDLAASGGYYVSLAGDWIIAEPTAIVGSIGIILQTLNWRELSERIGIRDTTITSGDNKDLLNPFREVSDDQMALLQNLVDSMHRRFRGIVQEHRGLPDEVLDRVADGRIFTSADALTENLIDEIGYWDDVVARTAEVLGVESVRVVRYERRTEFWDWFMRVRSPLQWKPWMDLDTPRLMYLWRP